MSGDAGGGYRYPDGEDEAGRLFTGTGPWLTIVNPDVFMTWCSGCGAKLVKGGKVRRAEGGYGYLCERCGRLGARTGSEEMRENG